MSLKILIVGAGGVGGYFGAHLAKIGADVTFLLRGERAESVRLNGLSVSTPDGDFLVQSNVVLRDELQPDFDLVILAPKAYDLDSVLDSLEPVRHSKAVFLPFLNGLSHIKKIEAWCSADQVMGGMANIVATLTSGGLIKRMTDRHILTFGHRLPSHEQLARQFFQVCQLADFDSVYSEDIESSMWGKWAFLATLAGISTLFGVALGDVVVTPYGKSVIVGLYDEACSIAAENKFPISEQTRSQALDLLTQNNSALTASMMRDLHQGYRTEHEHILGDLIRSGTKESVKYPFLMMAYTNMLIRAKT